jgi:hypothetical protein
MRDQGGNFQIYGIKGVNLHTLWGDKPEAYYGMSQKDVANDRYRGQRLPKLVDHVRA